MANENAPDMLFLRGKLQTTIARDALRFTGINPAAENQLTTFIDVHGQLSAVDAQNDLVICLKGEEIEATKADIIMSLELQQASPGVQPDIAEAARGLLSILVTK